MGEPDDGAMPVFPRSAAGSAATRTVLEWLSSYAAATGRHETLHVLSTLPGLCHHLSQHLRVHLAALEFAVRSGDYDTSVQLLDETVKLAGLGTAPGMTAPVLRELLLCRRLLSRILSFSEERETKGETIRDAITAAFPRRSYQSPFRSKLLAALDEVRESYDVGDSDWLTLPSVMILESNAHPAAIRSALLALFAECEPILGVDPISSAASRQPLLVSSQTSSTSSSGSSSAPTESPTRASRSRTTTTTTTTTTTSPPLFQTKAIESDVIASSLASTSSLSLSTSPSTVSLAEKRRTRGDPPSRSGSGDLRFVEAAIHEWSDNDNDNDNADNTFDDDDDDENDEDWGVKSKKNAKRPTVRGRYRQRDEIDGSSDDEEGDEERRRQLVRRHALPPPPPLLPTSPTTKRGLAASPKRVQFVLRDDEDRPIDRRRKRPRRWMRTKTPSSSAAKQKWVVYSSSSSSDDEDGRKARDESEEDVPNKRRRTALVPSSGSSVSEEEPVVVDDDHDDDGDAFKDPDDFSSDDEDFEALRLAGTEAPSATAVVMGEALPRIIVMIPEPERRERLRSDDTLASSSSTSPPRPRRYANDPTDFPFEFPATQATQ